VNSNRNASQPIHRKITSTTLINLSIMRFIRNWHYCTI